MFYTEDFMGYVGCSDHHNRSILLIPNFYFIWSDGLMECKMCGKDCNNYISLGIHLSKSHKDTTKQDYYNKFLRKPDEGICPVCGKETNFKNLNLRL